MNNKQIKFSLVIPTYNSSEFIYKCLDSLNKQTFDKNMFEVLVVDDASNDNTVETLKNYKSDLNIRIFQSEQNGGPGAARNRGIDEALGEWILFIDSDDLVTEDYLSALSSKISDSDEKLEALGFNWGRKERQEEARKDFGVGRRDGQFLLNKKNVLLENFLSARMDGSVIYTVIKKELLERHNIRFYGGLHEDIDFIYKVYQFAHKTSYLDKVLYLKEHREESIINTVSIRHIEGYIRAWKEIGKVLAQAVNDDSSLKKLEKNYKLGLIGLIASRAKEIRRHENDINKVAELYQYLFQNTVELITLEDIQEISETVKTQYCLIANKFREVMETDLELLKKTELIIEFLKGIEGKSWSCNDLAYSVFLRADEINTCCRRFFVDNERKGDVTIFDIPKDETAIVQPQSILNAKKELYHKINTGIPNECDGCPFLEFKEWEPLNQLDVRYLSFEHHSVCNLRCSYCSDDYYGGKKAFYDVKATVSELYDSGALDKCHTIVWGGGEPTVGQDFEEIVELLYNMLPNVQHRIVTNALRRSDAITKLLENDKAQLTCSIDSGSKEMFKTIRGKDSLDDAIDNLIYYSNINAQAVTIKYLFTPGNGTLEDIQGFADLIVKNNLNKCLFQISVDFKLEHIPDDTLKNMILLFGLLKKANCKAVFFDEIILQRIRNIENTDFLDIDELNKIVGYDFIETPQSYESIVVWGASPLAKNMIEKSMFFDKVDVEFFVDSNKTKQEKEFCGKKVYAPEILKEKKYPIYISAVQGYSSILKELEKMGYTADDIVDKLII